jgi:hypothetical protein
VPAAAAAAACCCSEEGFLAFWKGNGVNIIRIFPYSAGEQRCYICRCNLVSLMSAQGSWQQLSLTGTW